ncbi:MAG TPA: sulfatase-like hydrolase/transferase [Thermoplasmata archaeon]|nr:sulfatase-like hydrolase/transferase [Thermoplasmata archaeon]
MTASRPNLLLVVLDCVRAWDFPGGADPTPGMPFVEELRRDSWEFPRAASVAHWTVPAHASIFTGLYPWQHGVHAKGQLAPNPSTPQLAGMLHDAGYATMSLSSNGLISPTLGLTAGAQRAAWGVSLFNRISERTQPPQGSQSGSVGSAVAERFLRNRMKSASYWAAVYLARYPGFWDLGTHVVHRMRHGDAGPPPRMAPWLEPTLGRWLADVPPEQPAYCFINLLDAHEPYLSDLGEPSSASGWWDYARTRQDRLGWVSGEWKPTAPEFQRLHELYRGTLRLLDRRLRAIVEEFRKAGRWDNTLLVLTSDHGQAFGEHGTLFHITSIDEPELRIPLLVRPPGGAGGPRTAQGWASLVDIAPTFLGAAGVSDRASSLPGVDLKSVFEAPRPTPVFAMSDGLVHAPDAARAPSERRAAIDRLLVGAYIDDRKLILDPTNGEVRAFDVLRDRHETNDLWTSQRADFADLGDLAAEVARQLAGGPGPEMGADVEDRLRSWGYI